MIRKVKVILVQEPWVDHSLLLLSLLFFYLLLIIWTSRYLKKNNLRDVNEQRYVTLFIALVAYVCIFVASTYNVWTESKLNHIENQLNSENHNHNGQNYVSTRFGVYTAFVVQSQTYRYNSAQYRAIFCPLETLDDGTGYALANSGRVTLGFAITALVFGVLALYTQIIASRLTFWFSLTAFLCILVCLIVWGEVANVVIQDKCCAPPQCQLGDSYGLAAVAAAFFFLNALYQAWAVTDDIYVLHEPEDFGMTKL